MKKSEKKIINFLKKNPEPFFPTKDLFKIFGVKNAQIITNTRWFKIDLRENEGSFVGLTNEAIQTYTD